MRVFVTGATGLVGGAVAAAFARAGHEVAGLVRTKEKGRALWPRETVPVVGDMDAPAAWLPVARAADVVVHCAAELSRRFHDIDRATATALCAAAREAGGPRSVLYTSGVWVLGPTGDRVATEADPTNPPALVAPRVATERAVLDADGGDLRTIVIRPGCVYGGAGGLTGTWFHPREGPVVVGDGENRWSMVHVDDLADLYVRAAESDARREVFHAADPSRLRVRECAEAVARCWGGGHYALRAREFASRGPGAAPREVRRLDATEAAARFGPLAECMAMDQRVSAARARERLGWRPRHLSFLDGVVGHHLGWMGANVLHGDEPRAPEGAPKG